MNDPGSSGRPAPGRARGRPWLVVHLLVAAGVCAAYLLATGAHLLSDDWTLFRTAQSFDAALADFSGHWLDLGTGYYRPLASVSLALDYAIWGTRAHGYHATNLALFLLAAAATAGLAARLRGSGKTAAGLAAFGICLAHPVAVEPVAWICCRGTLLCGLLSVAGWTAFVVYVDAGRKRMLCLALLAQAAALASKEDALLFPGVALALGLAPGRGRRLFAGAAATLVPMALYGAMRVVAGVHAPAVGHGGFLDPSHWGDAGVRMLAHLRILVAPGIPDAPVATLAGRALGVVGLLLLLFRTSIAGRWRAILGVCLGIGISLWLGMPAVVTPVHGTRLLFQPLLLVAVLVGLFAGGRSSRPRGNTPHAGALVAAAGLLVLTAPLLLRWRDAGRLCGRVADGLHELHGRAAPDEVFVFVDPPAKLAGVPVFSEGLDGVLRPPFTDTARPVIQAYRELAIELLTRADRNPDAARPRRVLHWHARLGLLDAPAPAPAGPAVLRRWGPEALAIRPDRGGGGVVLRTPHLGLSVLVVQRLEVLLGAGAAPGVRALAIERSPGGAVTAAAAAGPIVRGERDEGPRLWIPIRDLPALRDAVRLERIDVDLGDARPEDVRGMRVVRDLPSFGIRASLRPDPAAPQALRLRVRLEGAARHDWRTIRIGIYYIRKPLAALTIPAGDLGRHGDDLVFETTRSAEGLARLGILPETRLFVRVDGFDGPCDPAHHRARSTWVAVERDGASRRRGPAQE